MLRYMLRRLLRRCTVQYRTSAATTFKILTCTIKTICSRADVSPTTLRPGDSSVVIIVIIISRRPQRSD